MKTCIICRQKKEDGEFNDEHVIPRAIQGYYHIYTVCTSCNSILGTRVDSKLTNHKFIEFQHHMLGVKNSNGNIPNPFGGVHTLQEDPEQKVILKLDAEGNFIPHLLPKIPKGMPPIGESFTISVDKEDKDKIHEIVDKFLERNGIPKDAIKHTTVESEAYHPWISSSFAVDITKFKLGLLKIAYEFAVDQIPEYFNDSLSGKISNILLTTDFEKLKEIVMFGDGYSKEILSPFAHLLDFEGENHYLILFNSSELGLICFVNLYNVFSIGFKMSDRFDFIKDGFLVGKNDIAGKTFKVYTPAHILEYTYTQMQRKFRYNIPDDHSLQEFIKNDNDPLFSFYEENGRIPFYNSEGEIIYQDVDEKIAQAHLEKKYLGDTVNVMDTEVIFDEPLYLKLLPISKLYKVDRVLLMQHKIRKL